MADSVDRQSKKVTREDLKKLAADELSKLRSMIRSNNQLASALEAAHQKRDSKNRRNQPKSHKLSA